MKLIHTYDSTLKSLVWFHYRRKSYRRRNTDNPETQHKAEKPLAQSHVTFTCWEGWIRRNELTLKHSPNLRN